MQIRVASLNFSGINISPFEYYDGTQEKNQLNGLFRSLMDMEFKEGKSDLDSLAKIDKNFQKKRYTLLYRDDVGVTRGKLLNRQQFEVVWDMVYENNHPTDQKNSIPIILGGSSSLDRLKRFDLLMYEAFLECVFGKIDWSKIKEYDSQLYLQQLKKWHSKVYLELELKVQRLNNYLIKRDLDILFLQQGDVQAISKSLPDNYIYFQTFQSLIIIKKAFNIPDQNSEGFQRKFGAALNFNQDSSFVKLKDYLLISSHLSSKKIKTQQAKIMRQTLLQISDEYHNLKIIVGVDANQYLKNMDCFNLYPMTEHNFTTRKRRTDMQLQFQKAGIIVQDVKDHIITNLKFIQSKIQTVNCEHVGNQLLPNQRHPYDHFIVYSSLANEPINFIKRNVFEIQIGGLPSPTSLKKTDTISTTTTNTTQKSDSYKIELGKQIPQLVILNIQNQPITSYCMQHGSLNASFSLQNKNVKRLLRPSVGLFQFKKSRNSKSIHKSHLKLDSPTSPKLCFTQPLKSDRIFTHKKQYQPKDIDGKDFKGKSLNLLRKVQDTPKDRKLRF